MPKWKIPTNVSNDLCMFQMISDDNDSDIDELFQPVSSPASELLSFSTSVSFSLDTTKDTKTSQSVLSSSSLAGVPPGTKSKSSSTLASTPTSPRKE